MQNPPEQTTLHEVWRNSFESGLVDQDLDAEMIEFCQTMFYAGATAFAKLLDRYPERFNELVEEAVDHSFAVIERNSPLPAA